MPFDVFTMAAVCDELSENVLGARIDKIIQPSELSVLLRLWKGGADSIIMSADPRFARVHRTDAKLAKGPETPSSFLMLLRKYCAGARIESVCQIHLERVLRLDLGSREYGQVSIMCEVMGNRSNIILASSNGEILGAVKLIGSSKSRVRRILPHVSYMLPPPQAASSLFPAMEKLDPIDLSEEKCGEMAALLGSIPPGTPARDALVGLLAGCSPSVADVIARRAGGAGVDRIESFSSKNLLKGIRSQYRLLETRTWRPVVILREEVPVDYRAYDDPPIEGAQPARSISDAIECVVEGVESVDSLQAARRRVRIAIDRRRSEIESRIGSLSDGLEKSRRAEELRDYGNYVLGYQYQILPAAESLTVPEMSLEIPLDPEVGPIENAERYFKRYRKARDAAKRVPRLMAKAKHDLAFVEDLDTYVELADSPSDLARIEFELAERFGGSKPQGKKKQPEVGKVLTVDLPGEYRILIGRSARQNEQLTFKLAGHGDLWLHARGRPGAHVVLRGLSLDQLSREAIANSEPLGIAASLAAYYSKGRSEQAVDVIVTRARDVHRLAGGAPGQVTVRNDHTLRVLPKSAQDVLSRTMDLTG